MTYFSFASWMFWANYLWTNYWVNDYKVNIKIKEEAICQTIGFDSFYNKKEVMQSYQFLKDTDIQLWFLSWNLFKMMKCLISCFNVTNNCFNPNIKLQNGFPQWFWMSKFLWIDDHFKPHIQSKYHMGERELFSKTCLHNKHLLCNTQWCQVVSQPRNDEM